MRLRQLLGLALLVRLPSIFFARGFEFSDQQFQYVDPAWGLATGNDWWHTWEWQVGIRSWVYPGLLAGLFRVLYALGLSDPSVVMTAVRGAHALVSLLPVVALWLYACRWRRFENAGRFVTLAMTGFVLVYSGVQPSGLTFAVGFAVAAVLLFDGPGLWPLASGLCLGLAFCCRFQDALFGPVLFAAGLVQRRWRASLLLCLGCTPLVVAQGLVDVATWGRFLHSALEYVKFNFVEDGASSFGRDAWWTYPLILLMFFGPHLPEVWRIFRAGAKAMPVPLVAGGAYIALHMFVERRHFRFVLPALVLLQAVFMAGLVTTSPRDRLAACYRRLWLAANAFVLVLASFWYFQRGAIEAALTLRADPTYEGRLVTVGMGGEGIGGALWLGRRRLELTELHVPVDRRGELEPLLEGLLCRGPVHVMACGRPLEKTSLAGGRIVLTELVRTTDWPDLAKSGRRFVYRATLGQ
jgi:hypothetical protein